MEKVFCFMNRWGADLGMRSFKNFSWIALIFLSVVSGCMKETPLEEPAVSNGLPDSGTMVAADRAYVNLNINMSGFRYVYQNRVPINWLTLSKYSTGGYCNSPRYIGSYSAEITGNSNLCGLASFLMGLSLVPHDTRVTVPTTDIDKCVRLAELARRYKNFDPNYTLGGYSSISYIKQLANGTSSKKGEFTNWGNCNEFTKVATELKSTAKNNTGRTQIKDFIRNYLSNDRPVVAIIAIKAQYGSADNINYIAESGGVGHYVVITGVTEDDANGIYKVRFKDPWPNNSKTYEVSYTRFLNSMVSYTSYYNALGIIGM